MCEKCAKHSRKCVWRWFAIHLLPVWMIPIHIAGTCSIAVSCNSFRHIGNITLHSSHASHMVLWILHILYACHGLHSHYGCSMHCTMNQKTSATMWHYEPCPWLKVSTFSVEHQISGYEYTCCLALIGGSQILLSRLQKMQLHQVCYFSFNLINWPVARRQVFAVFILMYTNYLIGVVQSTLVGNTLCITLNFLIWQRVH